MGGSPHPRSPERAYDPIRASTPVRLFPKDGISLSAYREKRAGCVAAEAADVTCAPVGCSAWLGVGCCILGISSREVQTDEARYKKETRYGKGLKGHTIKGSAQSSSVKDGNPVGIRKSFVGGRKFDRCEGVSYVGIGLRFSGIQQLETLAIVIVGEESNVT